MFHKLSTLSLAVAAMAAAGAPAASAASRPHAATAATKTLYVSAKATSDPACAAASSLHPFATIAGALECSSNGSLIEIGAGQFAGGFTISDNVTLQGVSTDGGTVISTPTAPQQTLTEITAAPGATVTLKDLTINGASTVAGDVGQRDIVATNGSLTLIGDTVENGTAIAYSANSSGDIAVTPSSGSNSLTLLDTTVSGDFGVAGGVYAVAPTGATNELTIDDSTITGNSAIAGDAGGITAANTAVTITSSTIDANTSLNAAAPGGLLVSMSTATVTNTVLAGNGTGGDCEALQSAVTDGGNNIIGINAQSIFCSAFVNDTNGDQVGSQASPLNPGLAALAANGGPAPTQALLAGSPALGAGSVAACTSATVSADERGVSRNAATQGSCDVGAFDLGKPARTLYVSATASSDPSCAAASATHPFATIAGALACSSNGALVKIGAGTFAGGFTIPDNVSLQGVITDGGTTISTPTAPQQTLTEVTDAPGTFVVLRDLTVNGAAGTSGSLGQRDITATSGSLNLIGDTVENGTALTYAAAGAGAISITPSTGSNSLTLLGSTVSGSFGPGGAIESTTPGGTASQPAPSNQVTVDNSTITGNTADASDAGGINTLNAVVAIDSSTIDANTSLSPVAPGGLLVAQSMATVTNTILAGNGTGGDCDAPQSTVHDGGNNLVGMNAPTIYCAAFANGTNGDQAGTQSSPINPGLGALAANGGPTPTQSLLTASPAINAGNVSACEIAPISDKDERGVTRNAFTRGTCDIGAYDTAGK